MEDNHIDTPLVRSFVATLRSAEQADDVADLAAMFTDDAELFRLDGAGLRRGDARGFWESYRAQFSEVRTVFTNAVETDAEAALEWHSSGTLSDGKPFTYEGSTFLTHDGEHITGLRTYYDTAAFLEVTAGT
ncbi:nuclear transport factor 2 family protein [Pseudonocardia xishanensis]|uniref:SnoaL-like domain-containing protein n=1 Tax=Pseudonocardia xishanensis TaxID=630995 RepID=A0ABP8RMA4_9PSEU